jgi:MFS family permease
MQQSPGSDSTLERSALIVATLTSFMGPFMISSVNVALPASQADLQMDDVPLSWISTAYLLAVYTIGSSLAAFANSATVLIGLRAIQGLGGALFVSGPSARNNVP